MVATRLIVLILMLPMVTPIRATLESIPHSAGDGVGAAGTTAGAAIAVGNLSTWANR